MSVLVRSGKLGCEWTRRQHQHGSLCGDPHRPPSSSAHPDSSSAGTKLSSHPAAGAKVHGLHSIRAAVHCCETGRYDTTCWLPTETPKAAAISSLLHPQLLLLLLQPKEQIHSHLEELWVVDYAAKVEAGAGAKAPAATTPWLRVRRAVSPSSQRSCGT